MENFNIEFEQKCAYKKIEEKIKKSKSYYDFLWYVTNLEDFKKVFTFEKDKFDIKTAEATLENLDALRFICNDENGLHKEDEFHDFIVKALEDDNAISTIINTYLIETKYGNPKRVKLDDYTPNDKLFMILQSVFGLDTLILSVTDVKKLQDKFNMITNTNGTSDLVYFTYVIGDLYKISKEGDEAFSQVLESYKDYLKPFVLAGLEHQLAEVSNASHESFDNYNILYDAVTKDVLKIENDKKM